MTAHVMLMGQVLPFPTKSPDVVDSLASESSGFRQTAIIIGAISLVALAILLWAIFIRKPRHSTLSGRTSERGMLLTDSEMRDRRHSRAMLGFGKRRKHRRRRTLSRNPTLAETGGLPPVREDATSEDFNP